MVKKDLLTRCKGIPVFCYSLLSLLFILCTSDFGSLNAQTGLACGDHINVTVSGAPADSCGFRVGLGGTAFLGCPSGNAVFLRPNGGTGYMIARGGPYTVGGKTYYRWPRVGDGLPVPTRNYIIPANLVEATGGPTWAQLDFFGIRPIHLKSLLGAEKRHIYECATGTTAPFNRCWGTFSLEDKFPPAVTCLPNETVQCDSASLFLVDNINSSNVIGRPTITDNCGLKDSTLVVEDLRKDCGGYIVRHWSYTDCGGMIAACKDTIFFTPLDTSRVMCPDSYVKISCSTGTTPDAIYDYKFATTSGSYIDKDTTALKAAYPFYKTNNVATFDPAVTATSHKKKGKLDTVCKFITTYADQTLYPCGSTCNASKKIIRTWNVMDWCRGTIKPCIQIIEATSINGPTIQGKDIITSVDPWTCASNFTFPDPEILHDECDPNPTYYIRGPIGVNIIQDPVTKKWIAVGAPKGIHEFYYVGKDCCGHEGSDTVTVTVVDQTPPVAVAKLNIIVSLTTGGENDGIAKLFANSVDNGSYDSCTPVHIELRRDEDPTRDNDGCGVKGNKTYNADGHPQDGSPDPSSPDYDPDNGLYVKFCCDDITNRESSVPYGIVKVWMRVWDDGNLSGKYGDTINGQTDNYNETWVNVRVEDKLTPKILCPKDVTIYCDDDAGNLALTGKAKAYSNCIDHGVDYRDISQVNGCGQGTITRTWYIKSNPNITCVQKITKVDRGAPFDPQSIDWPDNIETNCADPALLVKPTWTSSTCDQIGLSLKSDTFYFESNVCMKILNKWTLINWCTYDPNSTVTNPPGIWSRTQIIKIVDKVQPTLGSCDSIEYEISGSLCGIENLVITQSADDQGQCASDWLKWVVFVDLWGDGTNDLEYSSFLPVTDGNINNDTNGNGINDRYVAPTSRGENVNITIPYIEGSISNHKVYWKVTDGCGNVKSCTQNFSVIDRKKPTPYCLSLSSALMKNGQVELWAVDFNVGSSDNCTDKKNLIYTFDEAHPVKDKLDKTHYFTGKGIEASLSDYNAGNAQKWIPASKSSGKVFGCSSLPAVDIKMTVWDERFNFETCIVKLSLLDNQGACGTSPATGTIAGKILSPAGQGVLNTEVVLDNGIVEMLRTTTTNTSGEFNFITPMHYNYQIAGRKRDDYLNGVSTLDLVLMQKHILGVELLTNPYHIIAADANADQKVSASDLTELRKLILGIYDTLPKSDSWKFINSNQTFADPSQPWPLTEKIAITDMNKSFTNQNFIGVKVGDVNGSATVNATNHKTEVRNHVELATENIALESGKTHMIGFNGEVSKVFGLQFTLNVKNAELKEVFVGDKKLGLENIAKFDENTYTISWNDVNAHDGSQLLTINLLAKTDGRLSDMISINSTKISSEIYSGDDLHTNKLSLRFDGTSSVSEFVLYQNEPNPFNDKTVISFNLPEAGEATLKVFDVTGQVVYKNNGSFGKGMNSFTITKNDLPSQGVMIYQVESGANVATKKMIGLE